MKTPSLCSSTPSVLDSRERREFTCNAQARHQADDAFRAIKHEASTIPMRRFRTLSPACKKAAYAQCPKPADDLIRDDRNERSWPNRLAMSQSAPVLAGPTEADKGAVWCSTKCQCPSSQCSRIRLPKCNCWVVQRCAGQRNK